MLLLNTFVVIVPVAACDNTFVNDLAWLLFDKVTRNMCQCSFTPQVLMHRWSQPSAVSRLHARARPCDPPSCRSGDSGISGCSSARFVAFRPASRLACVPCLDVIARANETSPPLYPPGDCTYLSQSTSSLARVWTSCRSQERFWPSLNSCVPLNNLKNCWKLV